MKPDYRKTNCCPPTVVALASHSPEAFTAAYWTSGRLDIPTGPVPIVATRLKAADRLGTLRVRLAIGRQSYRIVPGLYAVGKPTVKSPVFVSANYKLSFDRLRSNLSHTDGWILVLDTRGINVWCAAGKGTFGTDELVRRIEMVNLGEVVTHRKIIVPQLGAPGVAAHEVKDRTGFRVVYGPVRAEDIEAFLAANSKVTPEMRRVRFRLWDRMLLIPADLVGGARRASLVALGFLLLSGFGSDLYSPDRVFTYGLISAVMLLIAYVLGTSLPPLLLPWLPGRSLSLKGAWVGVLMMIMVGWYASGHPDYFRNSFDLVAWFFMAPAITSFIAINFTGSTTYTSLSGVLKEMRIALPLQIGAALVGLILWIMARFI